ncbi:unnamed protein product [Auanema sp. JU1783]|nr:unnamed protein product [Auanema sp. JU1783]
MEYNFKIPLSLSKKTNAQKETTGDQAQPRPLAFSGFGANLKNPQRFSFVRTKDSNARTEAPKMKEGRLVRRVNKAPSSMVWTRKNIETEHALSPEPEAPKKADHDFKIFKPSKIRFSKKAISLNEEQVAALNALFALKGKLCPGDFDKYELLKERDKLLCEWRRATEKAEGKAKKITGECTAMCSESERYTRIVQKRLSPYECDHHGQMIEHKMVKDYARSAADQEKPLPHELRTKKMLHASLSYLLLEIFDNMPDYAELAAWYDFLWSRTRALRKEVTQLSLSDETAILLVENCTRFHILSAYQLCTLPVDQFDEKMNSENLGKCLQTLRHLYHDLEKRGIFFETEAEFRAYDVMLHFHDSNVLRQVLSYRKEVRESKAVRLAIQLAGAIQNKNYVRFFRLLMKEGSFLQCCICHRVFGEIRTRALSVMVKAYQNSLFSIDKIAKILGFDDHETCIAFLEDCNLQVESGCDQVVLHKEFFRFSVSTNSLTYQWIDRKNSEKFSKVVYGSGELRYPEPSEIPNSFDSNGCYTQDAVLNRLITEYSDEVMRRSSDVNSNDGSVPRSFEAPNNPYDTMIKTQTESILEKAIEAELKAATTRSIYREIAEKLSESLINDQFRKVLYDYTKELEVEAKLREKQERILNERLRVKSFASTIAESEVESLVEKELKRLIDHELSLERKSYIADIGEIIAHKTWERAITSFVDRELKILVKKTITEEENQLRDGLYKFRDQMKKLWLKQFWDTWRNKVITRRKFREERAQQWDSFQPNFKCDYFNPARYINNKGGASNIKFDSEMSLKLAFFKHRRINRICRKTIQQWRYFCDKRKRDEYMARVLAHRSQQLANTVLSMKNGQKRKRISVEPSIFESSFGNSSFHSIAEEDSFYSLPDSSFRNDIMNSTALTYHSTTEFRAPTALSNITLESENNLLNNTILSEKEISFARRALERLPSTGSFADQLGSTSFSLPASAKELLSKHAVKRRRSNKNVNEADAFNCEELLNDAKKTKENVQSLEKKADELKSSLIVHQEYLDKLIKAASHIQSRSY